MWRLTFACCVAATTIIAAAWAQPPADPAAALPPAPLPEQSLRAVSPEPLPAAPNRPAEPAAMSASPGDIAPIAAPEATTPPPKHGQVCASPCRRNGFWHEHLKPCLQYTHWGYADLFEEPALGASVRAAWKNQVCNGLAAQMVLYHYDFCPVTAPDCVQLNSHGQLRLQQISGWMQSCGLHPLLIEATGDARLDTARRLHVLKLLAQSGFVAPEEWVVVGVSDAPGLRGEEATRIDKKMLDALKNGGQSGTQGGGGGGGAGMLMMLPMGAASDSGNR